MKETVLVTGGAGYIGSHTAVELIQAGFDVVIADNLSNSDLQAVEGVRRITSAEVPFEQIDCCDLQAMRRLFERHEFRSVIHFAASKAVGESVAEPLKYYRNNLLSFLNVVELMCDFGRPNILFSSSCTVYGEPDAQPVTEQTPRKPATSPYGNTKQISEDILRDAVAAHPGLRGIALRAGQNTQERLFRCTADAPCAEAVSLATGAWEQTFTGLAQDSCAAVCPVESKVYFGAAGADSLLAANR